MTEYGALVTNGILSVMSRVPEISTLITDAVLKGSNIWLMGNGGSASTSDHFATDLAFIKAPEIKNRIGVFSLCSNTSLLTAIANDIGFENVFAHQLKRLAIKGDICVFISASGNSKNLLTALDVANEIGLTTIGFLGFDGGTLAEIVDYAIVVETPQGAYGPVEDVHLSLCHQVAAQVKQKLLEIS